MADAEKKRWVAVKQVGLAADRNSRHRRKMEDAHCHVDSFAGVEKQAYFGVYDGHGGNSCALYCAEHLHKNLEEELKNIPADASDDQMRALFTTLYSKTDTNLKESVPAAGACVVSALIRPLESGKRKLFVANVGDSRAVLSRDGKAEVLTANHHVENEDEVARIKATGGFIIDGRVNAMIAITRSLGDHHMKQWLINEPHFYATELQETDTTLILACDGLWDVVEPQAALDFIKEEEDAQVAAKKLLVKAIQDGSTDNLTVMVVRL
eukprot:TRINITY_DN7128_c0_g1_i1.p1 TRINITY_DN7128_c0_g1~~TRINITY_DN7128_c0_g1_i1.p1  ORF type:complete len:293 (-),score=56.25 TRINITY_DN7128_c0_g1_i1:49-849(-)